MRIQKLMKGMLVLALVGLVAMSMMPTAAAQYQRDPTMTIKVDSQTDQKLIPLQAPISLKGTVDFTADTVSPRGAVSGVTIQLRTVQQPAWATVVISPPQIVLDVGAAPSGSTISASETFTVLVSASDQAPAFQEAQIVIEAKALATEGTNQAIASAPASIRASYFSILDISLPESIKVERPQTPVLFPVTITNFGNGPTKVLFDIVSKPENPSTQIIPPQALTLEARQTGGSQITKDAILQVQTPYKNGYMNEPGAVTMKISSHYATNPELAGASDQVTVLVTTKGFYVPGPSPLLFIGLIALSAVLFRRLNK